jgi:hypothetical protein
VEIPGLYELVAGDSILMTLSGDTNFILLDPGYYHIDVHNTAAGIKVNHPSAEVDVENGMVDPLPGWFFTWTGDFLFGGEESFDIHALMRQQVRQLTFSIIMPAYFADLVDSIEAVMHGVAWRLNVDDGSPLGEPASVGLLFDRRSDSTFVASVRLMGITGNSQVFSGKLTFAGDVPEVVYGNFELHEELAGFNDNKKEPMTLFARIIPLYDPGQHPPPPRFEALLTPWVNVPGDSIIIYQDTMPAP